MLETIFTCYYVPCVSVSLCQLSMSMSFLSDKKVLCGVIQLDVSNTSFENKSLVKDKSLTAARNVLQFANANFKLKIKQ